MLFFDYRESEQKFFEEHNFANYDIKFFKESLNEDTILNLSEDDLENTMIISVFINSNVTDEVISKFRNLRVVSTRSTGYDHIDIDACIKKNIALINVASYGSLAVAQFTFGLVLMAVRNLYKAIFAEKNNPDDEIVLTGRNLNELSIGVVGTGEIGSSICKIAHGFDMEILAYDIKENEELLHKYNVKYVSLEELLRTSDIVTLHLPYTKENYHMFSDREFGLMKEGSYFVNVARGELVDNNALLEFVKRNKFKGVALDVIACPTKNHPEVNKSSLDCIETSNVVQELSKYPNVLITPHIAYDTQEAVNYILNETFNGLSDYVTGGRNYRVI